MSQKTLIKPQNQEILHMKIEIPKNLEGYTGFSIPRDDYENSTELKLSSAVVTVGKGNMVTILPLNLNDHGVTIPKSKEIAVFQFLSPQEQEALIEIGSELIAEQKEKW